MSEGLKEVVIYADGYCLGNPGPGGYGVVILYGEHRKELFGGFRRTTNNRMELMAVIVGLRALRERCSVTVYSDSKYVVDSITEGRAALWQRHGWMRNKKHKAINPDLWQELLNLCGRHEVKMTWVKGHSGIKENERADELSMKGAMCDELPPDNGYNPAPTRTTVEPGLFQSER